jgi:Pectate lyase superfamily protein
MIEPPPAQEVPADTPEYRNWIYRLWQTLDETVRERVFKESPDNGAIIAAFRQAGSIRATSTITNQSIYINVKDYGAIGNGLVNDAPAIQSAISFCALRGGTVFFPAGNYLCNSALNVNDNSKVKLLGSGASSKLTKNFAGDFISLGMECIVDAIEIDSNATTGAIIVISSGANNATSWREITNCIFSGTNSTWPRIRFAGAGSGYRSVIANNQSSFKGAGYFIDMPLVFESFGERLITGNNMPGTNLANLTNANGTTLVGNIGDFPLLSSGTRFTTIAGNTLASPIAINVTGEKILICGNNLSLLSLNFLSSCNEVTYSGNRDSSFNITSNAFVASNNNIHIKKQFYTPTLTQGAGFNIGDGQLVASWSQTGDHVQVQVEFLWGSTTVAGSPAVFPFVVGLPTPYGAASGIGQYVGIGVGIVRNSGTVQTLTAYTVPSNTAFRLAINSTNTDVSAVNPAGFIAGDFWNVTLTYKIV